MSNLNILDLFLDRTGSDVSPLSFIFSDRTGSRFRLALIRAFSFAEEVDRICRQVEPKHYLEIWDRAAQVRLAHNIDSPTPSLVVGTHLHLEKERKLSPISIPIFDFQSTQIKKKLTFLPDGLIETRELTIVVEIDRGATFSRWCAQLSKAIRATASDSIDGVLYCFYIRTQQSKGDKSWFSGQSFCKEFQSLFQKPQPKPIGIFTIQPEDVTTASKPSKTQVAKFLRKNYDPDHGIKPAFVERARRLADKIEESVTL